MLKYKPESEYESTFELGVRSSGFTQNVIGANTSTEMLEYMDDLQEELSVLRRHLMDFVELEDSRGKESSLW